MPRSEDVFEKAKEARNLAAPMENPRPRLQQRALGHPGGDYKAHFADLRGLRRRLTALERGRSVFYLCPCVLALGPSYGYREIQIATFNLMGPCIRASSTSGERCSIN